MTQSMATDMLIDADKPSRISYLSTNIFLIEMMATDIFRTGHFRSN
jgi:hypothetical protein